MLRITALLTLFFIVSIVSSAQIINVQSGLSYSYIDSKVGGRNTNFLGFTRTDLSLFGGVEYLNKKYFSVSSNVGFIRRGGEEPVFYTDNSGNILSTGTLKQRFDFLSINSTFNLKYPIKEKLIPYLSLGPRIDLMTAHDHTFAYFDYDGFLKKRIYGMVVAAGLRYRISKLLLGLRYDHLVDFNVLATDGLETNAAKTHLVSITLGYSLK